jgi:hypothetical protein
MIMKNDKNGIRQDKTAMNSGEEWLVHALKNKIHTLVISPLVGNADGVVHFYEDVYERSITSLLFDKCHQNSNRLYSSKKRNQRCNLREFELIFSLTIYEINNQSAKLLVYKTKLLFLNH